MNLRERMNNIKTLLDLAKADISTGDLIGARDYMSKAHEESNIIITHILVITSLNFKPQPSWSVN